MFGKMGGGLPTTLVSLLAALLSCAPQIGRADSTQDLGTVLAGNKDVSTFYGLIKNYPDIILQLPSYAGVTIVAPNDDAFTKLGSSWDPKNDTLVMAMLKYHILKGTVATAAVPEGKATFAQSLLTDPAYANVTGGQNVIINKQPGDVVVFTSGQGSRSTQLDGDITFTGGLVQVVDSLMVRPARLEPTARDNYKDLTAFLSALYAAGLTDQFGSAMNVTIFAPNNAAFQRVAGTLTSLSKDDLRQVLSYHVVPNIVLPSSQLTNGTALTTSATGSTRLHVLRAGNNLYLDAAQMIQPDILIANGVIHMIDNVLNPNASTTLPNPSLGTQAPAFAATGATETGTKAPVPFTTALPCTVSCPITTTSSGPSGTVSTVNGAGGSSTSVRTSSSKGLAAGLARCTGLAGQGVALGAGLVGMGMLMV